MQPKTLYEKLFESHIVREDAGTYLIYIDRHLVHEVTSPQAFEGLRINHRPVWRNKSVLAVPDHNVLQQIVHLEFLILSLRFRSKRSMKIVNISD